MAKDNDKNETTDSNSSTGVRICNVGKCDALHYKKGFCKEHYDYLKKICSPVLNKGDEDILKSYKKIGDICNYPNCTINVYAMGYCQKHFEYYADLHKPMVESKVNKSDKLSKTK